MKKITIIGITIIMFFFKNSVAANNKTKPLAASSLKNQIKGLDK